MLSPKSLVKTVLLCAATMLCASACTWNRDEQAVTYTPDKTYNLTILYTSGFPNQPPASHLQGSGHSKSELINNIREEVANDHGHLILISGGTESPDSPKALGTYLDELKYDAIVVNSSMFNRPLSYIRELEKHSSTPFISANLFESETGQPLFDAFTLISADDLDVAIIGITANEFREKHRKHLSGLDIINTPGSRSTTFLHRLRRQSDIVIAATHSGHFQETAIQGEIATYPGIDLVVGERQGISFATHYNDWITRVDLEFTNGTTKVVRQEKISTTLPLH